MAVHLINAGEKIEVRGTLVPKGGEYTTDDNPLATFLIRRRNFKRKEVDGGSQDNK